MNTQQIISGVAGRYARSLFELASEAGSTEPVMSDLANLQKAYDESADFRAFVGSPILSAQEQIDALNKLFAKFGGDTLTRNFVSLLAQNRRLNLLAGTIAAYRALLDESKGATSAEVISAEPLSESQTRALKEALKSSTGKDVALEQHIDQSLIGGMVVKLGSRMIDTSLKTKLSTLKVSLKGTA